MDHDQGSPEPGAGHVEKSSARPLQPRNPSEYEPDHVFPDRGDRIVAALAYIGVIPYLLFAGSPGRRFVRRHQHVAAMIHAIRVVWTSFVLMFWWGFAADGATDDRLHAMVRDIAATIVAGVPWYTSFQGPLLPWVLTPLVVTWLLSMGGFVLAWSGKSADFHGFTHADWNDVVHRSRWFSRSPEEERRIARMARERHLERIQSSTRTYASERVRRERMTSLEGEIEQLRAQLDHNDQLLSLGEISQRRYDSSRASIEDDIVELERMRGGLASRTATPAASQTPDRMRASRSDRSSEALVNTVAIVTPSGIPLFTYGSFLLDEAIVAGILSAFDSLSEEVFGSRVHKTQLAEGQVLYFSHGAHVLILAIFDDEPSPRQIEQLRTMLRQFEQANQGALRREQYDPEYLHQAAIPFKFSDGAVQSLG